jgi:hypothetical protein
MLDWLPIYPARVVAVALLGAAFQPYYASNSTITPSITGWQPTYPHKVERKVQHVSQKPALFQAGRIAVPDAPVPSLAWEGEYPALLTRRRLPVAAAPTLYQVPFSRATQLTQQPSYPDRIFREKVHPSAVPFSFHKMEAPPAVLSWKGEQPERVWPKLRLSTGSQQAYAFYPEVIPDPPPPGLGYETTSYPNTVRPLAVTILQVTRQQPFAANLDPIPNPPPPTDFTWPAIYPDFLPAGTLRRTMAVGGGNTLVIPPGLVPLDLRWAPSFPSQIYRRTVIQDGRVAPLNLSALPVIASELAWTPSFPDRLARTANVNDFIGFDPLSAAALFPTVPGCVEVFDETIGTATAVGTVVHASVTDEVVTGSNLLPEETC